MSTFTNSCSLLFQISPTRSGYFSVSGLDEHVHIFSSKRNKHLNDDTSINENDWHKKLKPVFTHHGHLAESNDFDGNLRVLNHLWHPSKDNLILSSANDGSLHAWQFVDS